MGTHSGGDVGIAVAFYLLQGFFVYMKNLQGFDKYVQKKQAGKWI